jgi:hypothetical protein
MYPEGTGDEGTFAYVLVVRSGNLTAPCDATFNIAGGTAQYGIDYTSSPAPGTIHFAPGENTVAIRVRIFEDTAAEGPATAYFSVAGADGASTGTPSSFLLHIVDTTTSPVIAFYEPGVYTDEGTGVEVVIQRVGPRDGAADVLLSVQNDTAVYGKDFICSPAPGRIQFGPGESVKTIKINMPADGIATGDRVAKLVLSDPHGANMGNTSAFALCIGDLESDGLPPVPGNTTTIVVDIPVSEVVPGAIFGFPAALVAALTGYVMLRMGGRRREGQ